MVDFVFFFFTFFSYLPSPFFLTLYFQELKDAPILQDYPVFVLPLPCNWLSPEKSLLISLDNNVSH